MDFWRSEAYQKFFNFLDTEGGFYYEVSYQIFSFFSRHFSWYEHFRGGVMLLYIQLLRHCFSPSITYTFSVILATGMQLMNIVLPVMNTERAHALAVYGIESVE